MKYSKFRIHRYKGIKNTVEINLSKSSLIPIIGVNECGKTTILEAMLSFDEINDYNLGGKHLSHLQNLYDTKKYEIVVSAEIEYKFQELENELVDYVKSEMDYDEDETEEEETELKNEIKKLVENKLPEFKNQSTLTIYRSLEKKKYSFDLNNFSSQAENDVCEKIVQLCPYMLYFDDFQDDFNGVVRYKNEAKVGDEEPEDVTKNKWYKIVNELFKQTDSEYSLKKLIISGDLKSNIISDVTQHLNNIINEGWVNFSLEKGVPPTIKIIPLTNFMLKFEIVEKITLEDGSTRDRHFGVKERSKGFFWFFSFTMKLYFNSQKRSSKDKDTIYLLDEPGSYLHSTAQKNLLDQLNTLSKDNKVLFTTHSPFLLDPEKIPLKNIRISTKSDKNGIELHNFSTAPKKLSGKNSPFQILLHYLEITPFSLNYNKNNIVITEGIFDYYWYEMMKGSRKLNFFPSSNADSIIFHISYMIADGKKYSIVWDNDLPGVRSYEKAKKSFGDRESEKWVILPNIGKNKTVLENLITKADMEKIRVVLQTETTFKKIATLLYYSNQRKEILNSLSKETKENFKIVYEKIEENMMK